MSKRLKSFQVLNIKLINILVQTQMIALSYFLKAS